MEIEFVAGEAGHREATALARVVERALADADVDSAERQLLETLRAAADARLAGKGGAPDTERAGARWWHGLFGPTRREMRLSAQRSAALDRATRAERSAFEALAETARVARERDAALARLARLEGQHGEGDDTHTPRPA